MSAGGGLPGAPIEVAAAVLRSRGRVLISRRPAGEHLGGLWEFPGGKRRPEETWEECVRRECREELGLDVQVSGSYEEVLHRYPDRSVRIRFYACSPGGGPAEAGDGREARWVLPSELPGYEFPPADRAFLARLAREPAEDAS